MIETFYAGQESGTSMNHRTGLDRSQTLLLPEALEDYVSPENPVRFLDAFVGSLDLHALGFGKAQCASTGRPPYDPAVLLKLYLYGYLHRLRSSRLLEAECHRNVELIWLLGKLAPDFKTIADFRKDNLKPLKAVCRQFTLLCRKLDLFGGQLLAIDGSKFRAVNSRDQNFNPSKLKELIAKTDARLADYFKMLDRTDAGEPEAAPLDKASLQQKIAALQDKRDWHAELLSQLDPEHKQISTTDPDTRRMHTGTGNVVGYNAQLAVDAKHKLIAADDVTNDVTDYQQLAGVALVAKKNLELQQFEAVADSGYYNATEVSLCVEQGITPFIPKADTSANSKLGLYGKNKFKFDPHKDVYVCPAGKELTYRFSTFELGRALRYYRARGCKDCALKPHCTRNKANRTITREDNEELMEQMAQRMNAQPEKFALSKQLAEHPFGTIKRTLGYTHFLLKGLQKVRVEWSLITLAYNLKRVLNLVSFQKLMAAVG
ncbi:MAG TPA: IS1182 family transposase [Candidatus Angelobacter sp.]|jgi:transposase|nr:IS1182 family transposase [Candidatus Angelobacter sp.]